MLADFDEPLVLADGTKIDTKTGKVLKERKPDSLVEIPRASEAQEIVAKSRRAVADMPVAPQNMNALSLICFYTMWGLNKQDIAVQLGISIEQIDNIKSMPEYTKLHQDIFNSVIEHEASEVRGFFQQRARNAAQKIVELAETEEGALGFAAAKDILDRAGHRPADVVEHRHKLDDTLRIEVVEKRTTDVPVLTNVTYKEI